MNHLQRYLVEEFLEDYQEGEISRRQALKLLTGITGAGVASQLLAACGTPPAASPTAVDVPTTGAAQATNAPTSATPTAASATTAPSAATAQPQPAPACINVAPDDPAIVVGPLTFPGDSVALRGYLARPAGDGTHAVVLICHENRGLTPHIEDVTRRVAKAGYVGMAVDLLSREGGTAAIADQSTIPGLLSGAPPARHVQDFQAALAYLRTQPFADAERAGMVGFCFGGGVTWLVAAATPELKAAVPFYGPPAPSDQLGQINAPVLAIYAEQDARINASIPEVEAAMAAAGKTYTKIIYPGVNHAFHNDTGQRYNAEAAQAAWAETLKWFAQYLV